MKRATAISIASAIALVGGAGVAQTPASPPAGLTLHGFQCGTLKREDRSLFADEFRYKREPFEMIAGCYLIRHPKGLLLWDTGVDPTLTDAKATMSTDRSIASRLTELGLQPSAITHVGVSHYHDDHIGGAAGFAGAELLIGEADWAAMKARPAGDATAAKLAPWLSGGGKVRPVRADLDVFGDGSVTILAMPGHTPGHRALLVRLPNSGAVLITGDEYHFRENRAARAVPTFNVSRADTLASHDRFERIATNLKARVVIQHDPRDMAALPAFPKGLD